MSKYSNNWSRNFTSHLRCDRYHWEYPTFHQRSKTVKLWLIWFWYSTMWRHFLLHLRLCWYGIGPHASLFHIWCWLTIKNNDLFDMINNGIRFTLLSNSSTLKQFPYTLVSQTFPMLRKINWSGWQGDNQLLVMAVSEQIEVMHVLFTTYYCLHCQDISMSLKLWISYFSKQLPEYTQTLMLESWCSKLSVIMCVVSHCLWQLWYNQLSFNLYQCFNLNIYI